VRRRSKPDLIDHGLEFLLSYDGRILYLEGGYHLKFEIVRTDQTEARPHGLSYSFTLHDQGNRRVLGYDNAHPVKPRGRNARTSKKHDHWHRDASDKGRPYGYVDAATLVKDFFDEAERYLAKKGIKLEVIGEGMTESGNSDD
jgi:hypothetical protein